MDEKEVTEVAIEILKERSKDIYDDGLKPATKEGGEALQAIVGLFNNVVLYPIKKANLSFKYKLEQFEEDLKMKIDKIPDEKFIEPPLNISGPTIEALKYTFDTKELREMYLNLLSSSMSSDTLKLAHPSYVEIIKAMTSLDANIFKKASKEIRNIPAARITITFGTNSTFTHAAPTIFAPDLLVNSDPFLVSSSIENLCRLGILTHLDVGIKGYDYDKFKKHPFIQQQLGIYKRAHPELDLNIHVSNHVIFVSDFGKNFADVCVNKS